MIRGLAIQYMKRGWPVFPVKGKIPLTPRGVLDATTDVNMVLGWPEAVTGVGLATGEPSGLFVVDIDGEEARDAFYALAAHEGGRLTKTLAARTKRGFHLFYQMPGDGEVRNSASKLLPHVDVRGTGGYVVMPGSSHPEGGSYEWLPGASPEDLEASAAPGWLLRRLTARAESSRMAATVPAAVIEGARNETLTSLAGSMRRRGMSEEAIFAALTTENEMRCNPPLGEQEVSAIAASVSRYAPAEVTKRVQGAQHNAEQGLELIDAAVLERISIEKQAPISACPVPWSPWSKVCLGAGGGKGLAHGWHVVVGAPSGAGKSLFATNFAAHAMRHGEHICMMTLEMSQSEVVTRLLAMYNGCSVRSLEHGEQFDPKMWAMASERVQESAGSIRINRNPIHTLADIRSCFERHVNDGCRVFITDYLQLAWVQDAASMREQVTEVSHVIRGLAREYDVLSLGLSQLNRSMTTSGGAFKKEGLIGGSSLENDADQVLLLSRPEPADQGYKTTCSLDKNRHGPGNQEWDLKLDTSTLRLHRLNLMGQPIPEGWDA